MKRLAARVAVVAVGLAAALAALVAWLNVRGEAPIDANAPVAAQALDAGTLERGAYLLRAGNCAGCHTARGGAPYAGGRPIETPFGTVYASNLTPTGTPGSAGGRATCSGGRSTTAARAMAACCIPRSPTRATPAVTRADADAMHGFLMSLAPVSQPNRPHALAFPFDTQAALAVWRRSTSAPPRMRRTRGNRRPGTAAPTWSKGSATAAPATPRATRSAPPSSRSTSKAGSFRHRTGTRPRSRRRARRASPSGRWTDVVRLLKTGVAERGTVTGPMAEVVLDSTQHLDDADLRAMGTYLQSLRPGRQAAPPERAAPAVAPLPRGASLYADHCAACHGERGEGVAGAYPALAGNRAVTMPSIVNLVHIVREGGFPPATAGNPRPFGMPPFATVLSDADLVDVLGFIRTSWGNRAPPPTPLEVLRARSGPALTSR
jgi:mono/diheme cytochrome c family protein